MIYDFGFYWSFTSIWQLIFQRLGGRTTTPILQKKSGGLVGKEF